MTEQELRQRLEFLSVVANGARVNGVALPDELDRECRELRAALAQLEKQSAPAPNASRDAQRRPR
jgi:hypothetical protein